MLAPHDYCTGWRQVRVFLQSLNPAAHHSFHYIVTRSLVQEGLLHTPFFVSHYICDDSDPHDTNIAALPPDFRINQRHASIRIRFRATGTVEHDLDTAIQNVGGAFWKSGFLDYNVVKGLSGTRFSDYTPDNLGGHEWRAQIVGEILHWNTRLYIDSFRPAEGGFRFEANSDVNNSLLAGNPFQSVLHMILNPRFLRDEVVVAHRTL